MQEVCIIIVNCRLLFERKIVLQMQLYKLRFSKRVRIVSTLTRKCLFKSSCLINIKAHAKINRKMGNSTPCKIVTPQNIILKLCTRDYVGEITRHANFIFNRYTGGFSQVSEILPPCDFFHCLLLSLPFSRSCA